MTESVADIARAAGARCYTDPFVPDGAVPEPATLMTRVSGWFGETRSNPIPLQPEQTGIRRTSVWLERPGRTASIYSEIATR